MSIDATRDLTVGHFAPSGEFKSRGLRDAIAHRAATASLAEENGAEMLEWAQACRELISRLDSAARLVETIRDNATTADARAVSQWAIEALREMEGR